MGIFLELFGAPVDRTAAVGIAQENGSQPAGNLAGHFEQGQTVAGAGGAFHLKIVAIELVKIEQAPNEQRIYRHPDRSAPVGVATKHAGVGFGGQILDAVLLLSDLEDKRMIEMITR